MRYEKGRKDSSRQRIVEAANRRFRRDGIAASGLAGVMSDAGLTNGAFYPHFKSKEDLVRECVAAGLTDEAKRIETMVAAGGIEQVVAVYLSAEHRDAPDQGCMLAALVPEIARQPQEARDLCADRLDAIVQHLASALPQRAANREDTALALYAMLIGALQLSRGTAGTPSSERILKAAAEAARTIVGGDARG